MSSPSIAPTAPDHAPALIFGEALLDVFGDARVPGGAPFNVACHLAALGLSPRLISRWGSDHDAAVLESQAARFGLDLGTVQRDAAHPTGIVLVREDANGHHFAIRADQAWDHIDGEVARRAWPGACGERSPWLYFGTLALRSGGMRRTLRQLRATGPHRAFVDINWREGQVQPHEILPLLHDLAILKLNEDELRLLLHWHRLPPVPSQTIRHETFCQPVASLLERMHAEELVVSQGSAGASWWDREGKLRVRAPGRAGVVVDTVGAGDALAASLLAGLILGLRDDDNLQRGTAFATAICGIRGALPGHADFYRFWRRLWGLHVDAGDKPVGATRP